MRPSVAPFRNEPIRAQPLSTKGQSPSREAGEGSIPPMARFLPFTPRADSFRQRPGARQGSMDREITDRRRKGAGIKPRVPPGPAPVRSGAASSGFTSRSHARSAWNARYHLLAVEGQTPVIADLLLEARVRDHEVYPVSKAARKAGVSVRHLHRIFMKHLGCPPGTVIDLARALSISVDLTTTRNLLHAIARRHGFKRQSDMNRFFSRFTVMSPRVFRARSEGSSRRPARKIDRRPRPPETQPKP